MSDYKLLSASEPCAVRRISDGACIPPDPANTDYAAYLVWKKQGGVPLPASTDVERRAGITAAVKLEAGRRILLVAPDYKQRNLTARAAELAIKGVANWTADEQAEHAAGQAIWDTIKAIRQRSNLLEAQVATMDRAALDAFDPTADAAWVL